MSSTPWSAGRRLWTCRRRWRQRLRRARQTWKRSRASPPWTGRAWMTLLERLGLAMDLEDLSFLPGIFPGRRSAGTPPSRRSGWWTPTGPTTAATPPSPPIIDHVEIEDDPAVQAAYERYLAAREEVYGPEKAAQRPQTLMDIATIGAKVLKKRRASVGTWTRVRRSTPAPSMSPPRWTARPRTGC